MMRWLFSIFSLDDSGRGQFAAPSRALLLSLLPLSIGTAHAGQVDGTAVALPKVTQLELVKVRDALDHSGRNEFERSLRARLKARGAECFAMLRAGMTRSDAIEQLAESDCMKAANDNFLAWLKLRRVSALLQRPALGSSASVPRVPVISTNEYIRSVHVARDTTVALLAGTEQYSILDLRTGQQLFHWDWPSPSMGELSPNGRVAAIRDANRLALVDVETGEVIHFLRDTDPSAFVWLSKRVAIFWMPASRRVMLVDFNAGLVKPAEHFPDDWPLRITALPGPQDEFLVFTGSLVSRFKVASDAVESRLELVAQRPFDVRNFTRNLGTLTSDGRIYVGDPRGLSLTSSDTLNTREVLLEPIDVRGVFALPDPDKVLLRTSSSSPEEYVYSVSTDTLAKVVVPRVSVGYFYVPTLGALFTYSGKRIAPADDLATAAAEPVDVFRGRMSHRAVAPLALPSPAHAPPIQLVTTPAVAAQISATPGTPKSDLRSGPDPATVVARIKPCQTTSAELATMLGIPPDPLHAGRQFLLGPLKSESQERRWLIVFVGKDGVVKDLYWDDLFTRRYTPSDSCPLQNGTR